LLLLRELVVLESEEGRGLLWDLLLRRSLLRFVAVRADLLRRLLLVLRRSLSCMARRSAGRDILALDGLDLLLLAAGVRVALILAALDQRAVLVQLRNAVLDLLVEVGGHDVHAGRWGHRGGCASAR